ncbi:sporulation protein [Hypoxylon sp. NC1633]|nr:sporulation protein [Hypoxylon sp. NC1633]
MEPVSVSEKPGVNKRKRDDDEHSKKKRKTRKPASSRNAPANGQPPCETANNQVNEKPPSETANGQVNEQAHETTDGQVNGQPPQETINGQINGLRAPSGLSENTQSRIDNSNTQVVKKKKKLKPKAKKKEKHEQLHEDQPSEDRLLTWKVSKPMGGRMLNIDPILTEDEMHLILAYNTSIQIYSATDSLLVRKILLSQLDIDSVKHQIISICLSPTSPNLVWVASSVGHLWLIDWTNGAGSETPFMLGCALLLNMSVERIQIGPEFRDVPFVSIERKGEWHIVACDVQKSQLKTYRALFSQIKPILNLRSIRNGYALIASSEHNILLGTSSARAVKSLEDLEYEFFTLDCSDEILCLDVRATDRVHLSRKSQAENGDEPVVEVALGCARGAIFLYNDLIPKLRQTRSLKRHSLQPRKLHWHRKAVHAVKWSRDGHYVLSGGSESTLVLWQLDTQKKDFLPHLSATIENIVVSQRGSAYVLHLDDNSAIVLSTAEMKPTTYVSGIQTLTFPQPFSKDDVVRRVGQYIPTRLLTTPATVNPADPSRIHFCVANGQQISYSGSGPSIPMIQTLDLTTMQSISKQALTRTNPTDVNITAKGYAITEPRITGMAYSSDGKWLATTDEWQPPLRDVYSLDGSSAERREVYLKFWAVSPEDQSLELVSRINAPHYTGRSEPVYGIAADPNFHRFATIGEDGVVRLWELTVRQRNGVLVKGKLGRQLHSWACSKTVYLQENEEPIDMGAIATKPFQRGSGAVSFSEDGSALVCAIGTLHGSIIHVIDTESGKIRSSIDGLVHGEIRDVRVLSSCLLVLSDRLMVYDLVSDELLYGVQLRVNQKPFGLILTHMAVDPRTSTFAVAVSRGNLDSKTTPSELAVFAPDSPEPMLVHRFPRPITSVIASIGSSGYIVLDSAAQLWSVSEGMDTKSLAFAQPLTDLNLDQVNTGEPRETESLALLTREDEASGDEMDIDIPDAAGDEDNAYPAVVPPQRLSELFNAAPAFAMPPIEDMFYQVTKLLSSNSAALAS